MSAGITAKKDLTPMVLWTENVSDLVLHGAAMMWFV